MAKNFILNMDHNYGISPGDLIIQGRFFDRDSSSGTIELIINFSTELKQYIVNKFAENDVETSVDNLNISAEVEPDYAVIMFDASGAGPD